MTNPERVESAEIPHIRVSSWRSQEEFGKQAESVILGGLKDAREGLLLRWDYINVFGDEVSIALENCPTDKLIGPHAVLHMTQGEETDTIEVNIVGVRMYEDLQPINGNTILDFGDEDQIPYFIAICARALEIGLSPDRVIDAAMDAYPKGNAPIHGRRSYHKQKLRDFSRQLSERQFL